MRRVPAFKQPKRPICIHPKPPAEIERSLLRRHLLCSGTRHPQCYARDHVKSIHTREHSVSRIDSSLMEDERSCLCADPSLPTSGQPLKA